MEKFFIIEYDHNVTKEIHQVIGVKELLKKMEEPKEKKFCVYESKCLLDWS